MVRSSKTERFEGKESRILPLFPELEEELGRQFEMVQDGEIYVLPNLRVRCNFRNKFEKIIFRSGIKPWPRLFQSMRTSRETELNQFSRHILLPAG